MYGKKYSPLWFLTTNIFVLINVSTERLHWRPMLRQMRESEFRQTLQMYLIRDTHKI